MKLYLFGGAEVELGQVPVLIQLINSVIDQLHPRQLLHIPFARTRIPTGEESAWADGWVAKQLHLDGVELLDARSEEDLLRANQPTIFINGGSQRDNLYNNIIANKRLHELVMTAPNIIGESAGAVVCGEYRRSYILDQAIITKGLGILENTLIEPHYTQRDRHQLLRDEMSASGVKIGIGIDSVAGITIDTATFPQQHQTMGDGLVELLGK